MSVPTSKLRRMRPKPRETKLSSSIMPGVPRSTVSCGSIIASSTSSGAAARQLLKIVIVGRSTLGSI